MNNPAETKAKASALNGLSFLFNPRKWSIKWKVRINYLYRAIIAAFAIVLLVNLFQRNVARRDAYDKLRLIRHEKSLAVNAYFSHLNSRVLAFASDRQTAEMLNSLGESFRNIENDNYAAPSAENLQRMQTLLKGFYSSEIIPSLETAAQSLPQEIIPGEARAQIMQYLYIAGNPKPLDLKHTMTKAEDGSIYSALHAQYHPGMLNYSKKEGIYDILLVDYESGEVVYSVRKNLDFATSLYEGPYRNSALSIAYKSAIGASSSGTIAYSDFTHYIPALFKTLMFVAAPVFSGSQLLGAAVFAIDVSSIDILLNLEEDGISYGRSLDCFIVGNDLLYRNNDRDFIKNPDQYVRKLRRHSVNGETGDMAARLYTTALVQSVDPVAFAGVVKGRENITEYVAETGSRVFCAFERIEVDKLNWTLVTQIKKTEAMGPVRRLSVIMTGIAIFLTVLLYFSAVRNSNTLARRLAALKSSIFSLSGKHQGNSTDSDDEIASCISGINMLASRIREAGAFVENVGKGNLDAELSSLENEDYLGLSLHNLKNSLVSKKVEDEKRKKEDDIRNWTAHGIAMFNDILRTDNKNLEDLSFNITRNMIHYLSANQGGFFLIEEEDGARYLNLVAAYAYDRKKFLKKRIGIGEGLAGACVLEKKTILLNKIPNDYVEITSGLGGARPASIMIVPLKKEEEMLGVIEIASFNPFRPHEVEFVEKVAESIAAALITVRLHIQTSQYLERFQQQAEEMKAQDEELRQNIEELQATHEQMERLKQEELAKTQELIREIENSRKLLIDILNKVPAKVFLKDENGVFLVVNAVVADVYNKTTDEIIGTSDYDNHPGEDVDSWRAQELEIMQTGEKTYLHEETSKGIKRHLKTIKMPFQIATTGKTGLLGIQLDVTDFVSLELELKEKQHELETASVELKKEKNLLDALLKNLPESIYFKDKQSRFIRFSNSMLKLFGLQKPEELLGKSDFDFFSEEHAKPAFEDEQRIIKTGKAIIDLIEKEVMPDGRVSWVNTTKMPLTDEKGEIIGTFGISKSITHLKKMEQEILEKAEKLAQDEKKIKALNKEIESLRKKLK